MQITFKKADWSTFWVQLELAAIPDDQQQQYIEQILESWYTLGLLGGFNATALPIQESEVENIGDFDYPQQLQTLPSLMHNIGEVNFDGTWARCCFDLGTTDLLALDILINALQTLDRDYLPLKQVVLGGKP